MRQAFFFTAAPDTTSIKTALDSAWSLMEKQDPQTVDLLKQTLHQSRQLNYKLGEGNSLYTMGKYYYATMQREKSITMYDSARKVFEQLDNLVKIANCYHAIGISYLGINEYLKSIEFFEKSAALNTTLGRKNKVADALTNTGIAYEALGDYAKALDYYFKSLKIDEETDYKEGIASDYSYLATVYGKMGETEKAYEFFDKSIQQSSAIGDDFGKASTYINYAILLKNNKNYTKAKQLYDEGLLLADKLKLRQYKANCYHNLGSLYLATGDYKKALSFFQQSIDLNTDESKYIQQANYLGLAETYFATKQYEKAKQLAILSLNIAGEIKLLEEQVKCAKLLSEINKVLGNFAEALSYYQQYTSFKDTLFTSEKSRQIKDLQTKYETEKKENEIATLDATLQRKTITQYALIAGFALVALIALGIFRNIRIKQETKRHLLSEQLKHEQVEAERLKELDHLKSRFFANIAHEFRTPLTLILGPVENLLGESSGSPAKNQLLVVKNSASRLVKLVNQLLDLSKLESGSIKFEYVSDDIIRFLRANALAFQSLADQKNIDLIIACDIPSLWMSFDKDKVEKIFSNLLSNAFKFTPASGTVHVTITTSESGSSKMIHVVVRDSGPGISPQDISFVFNRFYQSGTIARNTPGSGIGLELTKELVEICGGQIGVSNTSQGGAEFYFTLPVKEAEVVAAESNPLNLRHAQLEIVDAGAAPSLLPSDSFAESKDQILIIEDNDEVRDFIVSSLQSHYQIITAIHGEEGIAKAIEAIPDLIITDVMMPYKNGLEVCRFLKEDEKTSHIPIVMLTAKADVESKIEGLEYGADDYLPKPFHTKELLARMRNLISQRKRLQEKFTIRANYIAIQQETKDILPAREKAFMAKLREVIMVHLAEEEYSVEDLSRDMAMSRMQLHRKIKALTNGSASLYIRTIRLEHATHLLKEGLYNVSEVAYRVGFNSPTYFSTCFSDRYGFPPSELLAEKMA